ncbi:MAG: ABC transporter permease [Mucilaginibacter sp.]
MLKINLKLAFRNIFRNKLYTAINIIGLSVASAFCILVYVYVKNERSFDNFHHNSAQLFRVEESNIFDSFHQKPKRSFFSFLTGDADQRNMIQTPAALAVDLKKTFPEVDNAIRIRSLYNPIVRIGNQSFKESDQSAAYVDADFFNVFDFPLARGNKSSALSSHNAVVISQRFAKKYFGDADPVGKTLSITSEGLLLTISGVIKDVRANSSFRFDILVPREADPYYAEEIKNGTNSFSDLLILKLAKGTSVTGFTKQLDAFTPQYFKPLTESMFKNDPKNKPQDFHLYIRPFADAHYNQSEGWQHYTDLKNIYQLICLSVVILLIACLNYILLTLTSAMSRSQDVGIRKTVGAGRRQIVLQYYTETQLLAFIAVIAGFLLAVACLPFFSSLTGSSLDLANLSVTNIAMLLFSLAIILGLLAGIYPALAMSGLKPLNIMRGFSIYRINPVLSKILVVLQYTICIVLVISALAINKQMNYVNETSMGFDKEQVIVVQNPYNWNDKQNRSSLKERLYHFAAMQPYLLDITSTYFSFGGYNTNGHIINGKQVPVHDMNVDYNYFTFNKIPLIKGRNFSKDISADTAVMKLTATQKIEKSSTARHNVIVNETLYNMLGKPQLDVINRELGGVIIGVCKDYHTDDLTKKIDPAYHLVSGNVDGYFWIKIRPGQRIPHAIEHLQTAWNKMTNNLPFSYTFMDEDVAKSYDAYRRWMTTTTTSCILAIMIACLGLFGLSGLTTISRTKEIGIRKVLGASVSNLFLLLNRGTILLALGAFIIAAPIAYYLVHQWLDNFAYRIKPDWALFTLAGMIATVTAIIAVSYHTIRAAMDNPVKSLRTE